MADNAENLKQILPSDKQLLSSDPTKSLWWFGGSNMVIFLMGVTQNKLSNHISSGWLVFLWLLALVPFAIACRKLDKVLTVQGRISDGIKTSFDKYPVSSVVIAALLVIFALNIGVSIAHFPGLAKTKTEVHNTPLSTPNQAAPPLVVAPPVTFKPVGPEVSVSPTVKLRPKKQIPDKARDQSPRNPQPVPPQGGVVCTNPNQSICGTNYGNPTFNQYGAPKLVMRDDQRDALRDAMKPYAGLKFTIFLHDATDDSKSYADQLRKALKDAGLVPSAMDGGSGTAFNGGVIPSGVSAQIGAKEEGALRSLCEAMKTVGLIDKPVQASINSVRDDGFDFIVAPNR